MPRTPAQLEVIRARSKGAIFTAAIELFGERGYDGATIEAIARRAGVSKGLAYNYFPTKEAILAAIIEQRASELAAIVRGVSPHASAYERLTCLAESVLAHATEHIDAYRVYLSSSLHPVGREIASNLSTKAREAFAEIERFQLAIFDELGEGDVKVEAALFRAALQGIVVEIAMARASYPSAEVCRALLAKHAPATSSAQPAKAKKTPRAR